MKTQSMGIERERVQKSKTPATDYREFLRALRRGKWSYNKLTDNLSPDKPDQDSSSPDSVELRRFIAVVGVERFTQWIEKAVNCRDLTTDGVVPEVRTKKAGNSDDNAPTVPSSKPKRSQQQIQLIVEQMVRENGNNVLNRADRNEILARYGLGSHEVTEKMVEKADKAVRKEVLKQLAGDPGTVRWDDDEKKVKVDGTQPPIMMGMGHNTASEGEPMQMTKEAARELLVAAGFDEAENWSAGKMTNVLNDRDEMVDTVVPKRADLKDQLEEVYNTLLGGGVITVEEGASKSSANGKHTEEKPKKEPKAKKKRKKREGMSCIDAAAKVLAETKKGGLTAREITDRMLEKGYWSTGGQTPKNSVEARINVEIKNLGADSRFVKVGRGVFALNKA